MLEELFPRLTKYCLSNTSFMEIWTVLPNSMLPFAAHVALTQQSLITHSVIWRRIPL